jgi:hypothetical protein
LCVGFGIRLVISLVAIPVPIVLVDFAFPVTFAIGFLGLVALVGIFSWTSSGGFTWGTSGVIGMPSEDINRLAVFDWSDCIVVGVSICAGGVICSTVFCGVASGPGMVFILSAFRVRCVGEFLSRLALALYRTKVKVKFCGLSEYLKFYLEGQNFINKNCLFYARFFEFEVKS